MSSSILNDSKSVPLASLTSMSTSMLLLPDRDQPLESDALAPASAVAEPATVRPMPGLWESLLWTLAFFVVAQLVPALAMVIWTMLTTGSPIVTSEHLLPALLIGQVLGVGISVLALRVRVGRNWTSSIQLRRPALVPCLLAVLCVPALLMVGVSVERLVENVAGEDSTREIFVNGMQHHALWFCLLVVAVGAAVNEELFCRGFLGRGLVGRHGTLLGVLLTSIIFGAIHLDLPQGIWAFILGCWLHLAYLATRSLWVPILLHLVNNAAAAILFVAFPEFEPMSWHMVWFALPASLMAILSGLGLYRLRDRHAAVAQVA